MQNSLKKITWVLLTSCLPFLGKSITFIVLYVEKNNDVKFLVARHKSNLPPPTETKWELVKSYYDENNNDLFLEDIFDQSQGLYGYHNYNGQEGKINCFKYALSAKKYMIQYPIDEKRFNKIMFIPIKYCDLTHQNLDFSKSKKCANIGWTTAKSFLENKTNTSLNIETKDGNVYEQFEPNLYYPFKHDKVKEALKNILSQDKNNSNNHHDTDKNDFITVFRTGPTKQPLSHSHYVSIEKQDFAKEQNVNTIQTSQTQSTVGKSNFYQEKIGKIIDFTFQTEEKHKREQNIKREEIQEQRQREERDARLQKELEKIADEAEIAEQNSIAQKDRLITIMYQIKDIYIDTVNHSEDTFCDQFNEYKENILSELKFIYENDNLRLEKYENLLTHYIESLGWRKLSKYIACLERYKQQNEESKKLWDEFK